MDAVNKKGDVFKSSVGKAFINKLKRVSKNENEIHVKKPVPEQKVRYKQKEKVHDRVWLCLGSSFLCLGPTHKKKENNTDDK